jgi:hypothetical protein
MGDDSLCVYCGDPAVAMDHLVPVAWQRNGRNGADRAGADLVPACLQCNSLLGAAPAFTVRDRAAVLILAYTRRPRAEAAETARKLLRLVDVAAGYPLPTRIEALEERRATLAKRAEEIEADRAAEEIEEAKAEALRAAQLAWEAQDRAFMEAERKAERKREIAAAKQAERLARKEAQKYRRQWEPKARAMIAQERAAKKPNAREVARALAFEHKARIEAEAYKKKREAEYPVPPSWLRKLER